MSIRSGRSRSAVSCPAYSRLPGQTRCRDRPCWQPLRFPIPNAHVVVAELVPEVVDWNRDLTGEPSGHPLKDPRTEVYVGDVARLIREDAEGFDAIMMDIDNGPEALIRRENDWLYSPAGLRATRNALKRGGVLAVWSASPDHGFTNRLEDAGFEVDLQVVRPHRAGKGARHHIWLAVAPAQAR